MGKFDAYPTKNFFIQMLTRDISLENAIIDLIDNSVDGAKDTITKQGKAFTSPNAYDGFRIDISFNETSFSIRDNCGGFSKEAAHSYVFKFGRPDVEQGFPKGSVGRFGVGMKRALFKIGSYFQVETKTDSSHFIVRQNVNDWSKSDDWKFDFADIDEKGIELNHAPLTDNGTFVFVSDLFKGVALDFSLKTFEKKIIQEIERKLNYSIERGLTIKVNGVKLQSSPIELLYSEELRPYYFEEEKGGVNVKIFAGVGEPNPNDAGWYIFCNDRLMVDRDRTNLTGWEGGKKFYDDTGVQKYHNKVAMFRGLVFFTSDDSSKLPMTTTKWGIDANSTLYKEVRTQMIIAMKQVLSDLNKLKNADERQYIVNNSSPIEVLSYDKSKLEDAFYFPEIKRVKFTDNRAKVCYRVDKDLLALVKRYIGAKSNEEAGYKTFDYYVNMKELNDE